MSYLHEIHGPSRHVSRVSLGGEGNSATQAPPSQPEVTQGKRKQEVTHGLFHALIQKTRTRAHAHTRRWPAAHWPEPVTRPCLISSGLALGENRWDVSVTTNEHRANTVVLTDECKRRNVIVTGALGAFSHASPFLPPQGAIILNLICIISCSSLELRHMGLRPSITVFSGAFFLNSLEMDACIW